MDRINAQVQFPSLLTALVALSLIVYDAMLVAKRRIVEEFDRLNTSIQLVSGGQIIGLVVSLIVCCFVLVIGMNIYYTGYETIGNVVLGTTGNATRDALHAATWGAFDMMTVLPTILGGSAIIGALIIGFIIYRGRG